MDDGLDDLLRLQPRGYGCRLEPGPPNMYQKPARSGRMPLVSSRTCLPTELNRVPRHSPARRQPCIISLYIMAGQCRSESTATFDTVLDTVTRGAPPQGYTARWPQVRPLALALALPFARPRTSLLHAVPT